MKRGTTLKDLRAVIPHRNLSTRECYRIAELQAAKLRRLEAEQTFPSEAISELPRIQVVYEANLPSSGLSFWDGHNWIIVLDKNEPTTRQRFTMLHEFKHILDHPYKNRLLLTETQNERLADYFAACVLMPKSKIKWAWGSGQQRIHQLARSFGVSEPAMTYRLHQLGLLERTQRCTRNVARRSTA